MIKKASKGYVSCFILGVLWAILSAFPTPPRTIVTTAPPYYYMAFGVPVPWLGFTLHRGVFTFYQNTILIWGIYNYIFWTGIFYGFFSSRKMILYILGFIGLCVSIIFTILATTHPITIFYYTILMFSIRYIKNV